MKNNLFRSVILIWLLIFAAIGNGYAQKREIPKGWKEFEVCSVSFLAPKELKHKKALTVDACVAIFKSKNINLEIGYGEYTGAPEDLPDYQNAPKETTEIDGKKATISTVSYKSHLYVITDEWETGKNALGISFSGKTANDLKTARQIFQSVRFLNEKK